MLIRESLDESIHCPLLGLAFVVCVRKDIYATSKESVVTMLNSVLKTAKDLKASPIAAKLIAAEYQLEENKISEWLSITHWAENAEIDTNLLQKVNQNLQI